MITKAFECHVHVSHERGYPPFYVCRTQVLDRRSLRSILRRFCFIHNASYGFIVCGDIAWSYYKGSFNRIR